MLLIYFHVCEPQNNSFCSCFENIIIMSFFRCKSSNFPSNLLHPGRCPKKKKKKEKKSGWNKIYTDLCDWFMRPGMTFASHSNLSTFTYRKVIISKLYQWQILSLFIYLPVSHLFRHSLHDSTLIIVVVQISLKDKVLLFLSHAQRALITSSLVSPSTYKHWWHPTSNEWLSFQ